MISVGQKGDFTKITAYMERVKDAVRRMKLEKYATAGVNALSSATPVDSGETAGSWYYVITSQNGNYCIEFHNSHINRGINIAIILQYGHGTGTGGYVEGRDYINPAIQPVFEDIAEEVWWEVKRV